MPLIMDDISVKNDEDDETWEGHETWEGLGLNTRLYTLEDLITSKAKYNFAKRIISQAHADPSIKKILGLTNETEEQTNNRILSRVDKYK